MHLASISGGTDIMACFASNRRCHGYRGELYRRGLGMATDVFDDEGHSLCGRDERTGLHPDFPSMPLYFMNDPGSCALPGVVFRALPGLWCPR